MFTNKSLGIDISDHSVEALVLEKAWKNIKITNFGRGEFKPGLIEDGEIKDQKALAEKIKAVLAQAKPAAITQTNVTLSLPESKAFIHFFTKRANKNPEEIIQEQLVENIPYELDELYYDWIEVDDEFMVAAAPKKIIDNYIKALAAIDLKITALTIESLSTAAAILPDIQENQAACVLDLGARTTIVSIFSKKGLRYSHTINQAGQNISKTLSEKMKLEPEEAEKIKRQKGLALEEVKQKIEEIVRELKKAFNYYEEKNKQIIGKIILTGGSANLPELIPFLKQQLNAEICLGEPLKKITENDMLKQEKDKLLFANVIGLALSSLNKAIKINILPK